MACKARYVAVGVLSLCSVFSVHAADMENSTFLFSGYGTFGVSHSDNKDADFVTSVSKASGAGYTHSWSADVDSRIAGQVTANLSKQWSAVVQVISEQRYDNSHTPFVEWANIQYKITPDFSVRAGRIAVPVFLAADYRKVGYSIPWVRTPLEVYTSAPLTRSDGIDGSYRFHIGDITHTVQAFVGETKDNITGNGNYQIKNLWGITNTTEVDALTARLTYLQGNIKVNLAQDLFAGLRQFGPQGAALADKYESNFETARFLGVGANYDPGKWFVTGEWARLQTSAYIGTNRAWYVSGGYRFGALTPYMTYASTKSLSNTSDPGIDLTQVPGPYVPMAARLNAGLNMLLASAPSQQTVSVGGRWDFANNIALKVQLDQVKPTPGSAGTFINSQPEFFSGHTINVFSAVVDFVF